MIKAGHQKMYRKEEQLMEMTLRWYGSDYDTVTLEQIRQIPGVTGVITTLYGTSPGDIWLPEEIHALKKEVEAKGLHISGIESVNVHEQLKPVPRSVIFISTIIYRHWKI